MLLVIIMLTDVDSYAWTNDCNCNFSRVHASSMATALWLMTPTLTMIIRYVDPAVRIQLRRGHQVAKNNSFNNSPQFLPVTVVVCF